MPVNDKLRPFLRLQEIDSERFRIRKAIEAAEVKREAPKKTLATARNAVATADAARLGKEKLLGGRPAQAQGRGRAAPEAREAVPDAELGARIQDDGAPDPRQEGGQVAHRRRDPPPDGGRRDRAQGGGRREGRARQGRSLRGFSRGIGAGRDARAPRAARHARPRGGGGGEVVRSRRALRHTRRCSAGATASRSRRSSTGSARAATRASPRTRRTSSSAARS